MDQTFKKNLGWFGASYFLVLFNYPLIRASTTTLFIGSQGAKASPIAWLWAILVLSVTIWSCNRIQAKRGFHQLFLGVSVFSVAVFLIFFWLFEHGHPIMSYPLFIWKEIYIVVQVHLLLAYSNSWMPRDKFIKMIGPIGAIGGLGSLGGGLLTSFISKKFGTHAVLLVGQIFIFLPAICSSFLSHIQEDHLGEKKPSPLKSLNTPRVREYVLLIACIGALTQFIINIADFQFNLVFERMISTPTERTTFLGEIYSWTSGLTLFLQFLVLPFILKKFSERSLQLFIPASYFVCLVVGLFVGPQFLLMASFFYIFLKASDYSLFSSAKELLYHPLERLQKYGAKYITDMLVYRSSKALIATVLIYFQAPLFLTILTVLCLGTWTILVVVIFKKFKT